MRPARCAPHVGGPDYFDAARAGAVDLAQAVRSPGSALKPFIYAMAFEAGIAHPETMLEDRPSRFAGYAPENFDLTYQGSVTARVALQNSLNVPAVDLLSDVGPYRFIGRLRSAGAEIVLPREAQPGLAAALGGLGVRLSDLARLYVGLTRGGVTQPLRWRLDSSLPVGDEARLTTPVCRLVCCRCAARHAAAHQRAGRTHRLQDGHILWLSRRLGGGV
jgi:penicillin-binding protein 1C